MPRFMHSIGVSKISFVDLPANKKPFLMFKSQKEENGMSDLEAVLKEHKLDDAAVEAIAKAAREESSQAVEELKAQVKAQQEEGEALKKSLEDSLQKQQEELKEAKGKLAKAEEEKAEAELRKEVSRFKHLNISDDDAVALLKQAKSADDEGKVYEKTIETLEAANKAVEQSQFFSEGGSLGSMTAGSAEEELMAKARARVDDGTFKNLDDAIVAVGTQHPDLYRRHQMEKRQAAQRRVQ